MSASIFGEIAFDLHLPLDKHREQVAYQALEAVTLASKENWRAALALLDRFGMYIGLKREISPSRIRDEEDVMERIEGYQDFKRENDTNYITRLDDEKLDIPPKDESLRSACGQHRQDEKGSAAKGIVSGDRSGAKNHDGTGTFEICA